MKRFLDYDGLKEFKRNYDSYVSGTYATKEEVGSRTSFAYYDTLPILPSADVADTDYNSGTAKATLPDSSQIALKDLANLIVLIPTEPNNDPRSDVSNDPIDIKDEYILIRTAPVSQGSGYHHYEWEKVGNTRVDMSAYVRKDGGDGTLDVKVNILRVNPSSGTVTPGTNATQITSTILTAPTINAGKIKSTGSSNKAIITENRVLVTNTADGDSSDGGTLIQNGSLKTGTLKADTINRLSTVYAVNISDPSASAAGSWYNVYTDEANDATDKGRIDSISSSDIDGLFS